MLPVNIHLSAPVALLFAFLIAATCCAFSTLVCRTLKEKRPWGRRWKWFSPMDLLITASFIVIVTALSALLVRFPSVPPSS